MAFPLGCGSPIELQSQGLSAASDVVGADASASDGAPVRRNRQALRPLRRLAKKLSDRLDERGVYGGQLRVKFADGSRVRAVRGELGVDPRRTADDDERLRFHAARSALLLGDRDAAPALLHGLALAPGRYRTASLQLLLEVAAPALWQTLLQTLAQDPTQIRVLIRAVGASGDPHYVPWLIKQMDDLELTRLAGESFSLISGLDLAALDLERKPPEGLEPGPNDDPNDADVAMDEDDSLPWPDPVKIAAWWQANGARFAAGTRHFLGEPPTPAHCMSVLKIGYQRQRIAAAEYRCLLRPGTPLFGTAAPAWRQLRTLAGMER